MSLLFHFPEDAAGMLVITFCDREHEQFVDLAAFEFETAAEFDAAWSSVPVAPAETAFLVDRHDATGHTDDRYVTSDWIEARCGRRIAEMISDGRKNTAQWVSDWKAQDAAKRAAA